MDTSFFLTLSRFLSEYPTVIVFFFFCLAGLQLAYVAHRFSRFKRFFLENGYTERKEGGSIFIEKGPVGLALFSTGRRKGSTQRKLFLKTPALAFPSCVFVRNRGGSVTERLLSFSSNLFPSVQMIPLKNATLHDQLKAYSLTPGSTSLPPELERLALSLLDLFTDERLLYVSVGDGEIALIVSPALFHPQRTIEVQGILDRLRGIRLNAR